MSTIYRRCAMLGFKKLKFRKTKVMPYGRDTVKDLLEEIKNLSQLMLDLAYSSVFFKNKEIAEEVNLLYERLEILEEHLYMHLFAASRGHNMKSFLSVVEFVESGKKIATAARDMSNMVLADRLLHPVIKSALRESDESITRVKIAKKSILANKSLGDLKLRSNTGVDIIAIRRGKRWIFDPRKNTMLKMGDIVTGIGPATACNALNLIAEGKLDKF